MQCVNISLAAFPGRRHEEAIGLALALSQKEIAESAIGQLHVDHIQLVPQNFGILDEEMLDLLVEAAPNTAFRLHANVRVLRSHRFADLSNMRKNMDWFERSAAISQRLKAPAYTAHSGKRSDATMEQLLDNARRCADLFGCPVGIEGQYPSAKEDLMVSTWHEYRTVFESGVPYVLDLSHINILAHQSGQRNESLLSEMLSCERCIEVHLSDNDGTGDWHQVCEQTPWWFPLLDYINATAVVFSEGNHLRQRKKNFQN